MTARFRVSDEVRAVLAGATITSSTVVLPGKLDRALYTAVNKVLEGAGGKWDRRTRAHVFPSDPRELLGLAVETGEAVNVQQARQAFYTPRDLARRVAELAEIRPGDRVLEPSAGHGALVDAVLEVQPSAHVQALESDPLAVLVLRELYARTTNVSVDAGDFLAFGTWYSCLEMKREYDRVVMNPPFSRGSDVDHVVHGLAHLRRGGVLVSVVSAGAGRGRAEAQKGFARLLERCGERWELPDGTFKAEGTSVRTSLVRFRLP